MRYLLPVFFLLAGLACWSVLPALDAMPSAHAREEWSFAGSFLVLIACFLAFRALYNKEGGRD